MKKVTLVCLAATLLILSCSVSFADSETGVQLSPQKKFVFRHLAAGSKIIGDKIFYEDFVIVISYFGRNNVSINVRLKSDNGLDFTYENDNFGLPLKILAGEEKRTVMLNVTSSAFYFEEYHEGITVEVEADEPVYVIPPKLFSTSAVGNYDQTDDESIKKSKRDVAELAWERFGFQVPTVTQNMDTMFGALEYQFSTYGIFWRNLRAFPNGWDTKLTLTNTSREKSSRVEIYYLPDYNKRYNPETCEETKLPAPVAMNVKLAVGETKTVLLSEVLGETYESNHQTEGSLMFFFINTYTDHELVQSRTRINVEVIPLLAGGKRICDNP